MMLYEQIRDLRTAVIGQADQLELEARASTLAKHLMASKRMSDVTRSLGQLLLIVVEEYGRRVDEAVAEVTAECDDWMGKAEVFELERDDARDEIDDLKADLETLPQERDNAVERAEELEEQVEELEGRIEDLENQIEMLEEELAELRGEAAKP